MGVGGWEGRRLLAWLFFWRAPLFPLPLPFTPSTASHTATTTTTTKTTNPTTKINESKLKLKGAKRSYLSWYKKERAFLAEYKTLIDHELILIEFEKLQTELEDCLEGGWEDIDHSSDEMYANVSEEVKDVEYKFTSDPTRPSLRIMINTDQSKRYTLFVRIQ